MTNYVIQTLQFDYRNVIKHSETSNRYTALKKSLTLTNIGKVTTKHFIPIVKD